MAIVFWFCLAVLAIDDATDITTSVDILEKIRSWFEVNFPKLGKLARCKYCQSFWISLPVAYLILQNNYYIYLIITWLSLHRLVSFSSEFYNRFLDRIPQNVYVTMNDISEDTSKDTNKDNNQ